MTDPAPLTDGELAEMEEIVHNAIWAVIGTDDESAKAANVLDGIIADLRAARAEVERLSRDNAEWGRLHDAAERLCARCSAELTARAKGG